MGPAAATMIMAEKRLRGLASPAGSEFVMITGPVGR